ncbi:MAG: DEAD/DEAH box helicase family protein [Nanoarchaeota archaeon]|nr:DEAD/DEAH box helicase family protein [Nanoarchaeota archaeon]
MQIEIVSPVECRVLRKDGEKLRSCLSFSAYYYVQKQYKKECKDYQKYVFSQITDTHYYFWFGLLTRVKRFCKSKGIKYEINGNIRSWELSPPQKLHVPGIEFRKEQVNLIQSAILKRRGVIKAPTGSGKTILQLGIISCWREHKCLLLAHTLDIISQTVREIEEKFNCEVGVFAEGKKQTDKLITVATIQSVGNPIMLYKELINVMGKSSDINWWKQKEEIQKGNLNLLVEHTNFKSSTQLIKSKTPEAVTARKIAKEIKKCEHAINILPNCKKIEEGAKVVLDFLAENEIVIVDEAHHISKIDGAYAHALSHCFAPVRLGFTATLPTEEEAKFSL